MRGSIVGAVQVKALTRAMTSGRRLLATEMRQAKSTVGSTYSSTSAEQVLNKLSFVGCEDILRGSSLSTLLRSCGTILKNSEGSAKTYELSEPVTRIDCFISHNWKTPRMLKFVALAVHFNFALAAGCTLILMVLCFVLTACGILPTVAVSFEPRPLGICCRLGAYSIFLVALLFCRDVMSRVRLRGRTAFLDKTCVHQTDLELQRQGVEKLGAFLCHSDEMVVLYTDLYLQKLWTIYEVAAFLTLHPTERMTIVPPDLCMVLLFSFILIGGTTAVPIAAEVMIGSQIVSVLPTAFSALPFIFAVRAWARSREQIRSRLSCFTVRQCTCAVESDRQVVYDAICLLMRESFNLEQEPDDVVLDAFDELVRAELPQALMRCLGRFSFSFKQVVFVWACTRGAYAVDLVSGALAHGLTARGASTIAAFYFLWVVSLYPLCLALLEMAAGCCLHLRGWAEKLWLVAATTGIVVLFLLCFAITKRLEELAAESDVLMIVYVCMCVLMTLGTAGLYIRYGSQSVKLDSPVHQEALPSEGSESRSAELHGGWSAQRGAQNVRRDKGAEEKISIPVSEISHVSNAASDLESGLEAGPQTIQDEVVALEAIVSARV